MSLNGLSIVIFTYNDAQKLPDLMGEVHQLFSEVRLPYEVLIFDNNSSDDIVRVCEVLETQYPLRFFPHSNRKSPLKFLFRDKTKKLVKAFSECRYNLIATLSEPSLFKPITILEMVKMIVGDQTDVVVAQRQTSSLTHSLFGLTHDNQKIDLRSGLRVFKKEITDRVFPRFSPLSFDLEFLIHARDAGYRIKALPIETQDNKTVKGSDSWWRLFWAHLKINFTRSHIIPFHPETVKEKGKGFHYKGEEFIHHSTLHYTHSAIHRISGIQMLLLIWIIFELTIFLIVSWHTTIIIVVAILTALYFADLLFNLYLIYRSFSKPAEVEITKEEIAAVTDWPTYTILCPLYKEWQVIPQFVTAMSHLDYPKDKLQVMLLLEEDDTQSIDAVKQFSLPSYFDVVIVPNSKPKTKPKASNYGLLHATGEYVVIYDAEDIPDPLQLKKAIIGFAKTGERIVCIQAKLNFYNPHQNVLTRVFTAEYSLWFDLVLTGLQSIHAPIPLGGTSNHFKKKDLENLKGWDSFNVTEDCDLGMRLVKQGKQTAVINSITLEEANSDLKNWFNQRTRWIKGYMQTYLVHMRTPQDFFRNWREPHAITFQMVVGGKILSMFINPLMWVITICYFAFRANVGTFIESFFPAPVLYMGVTSLLLGNFLYVYYYMIGCAKHGHHELVKYGVFVPLYWLAMSVAAWMAVYRLIVSPHYWSKTKHGLHLNNAKAVNQATETIGKNLIDESITNTRLQPAFT